MSSPAAARRPRVVPRNWLLWSLSRRLLWLFCKVWHRVRFEGEAGVPRTGPLLLVANHVSYLDPMLVGIGVGRWVGFLAKAGLARLGPIRWWLAKVGVTLIDREAPSKDALRLIADALTAGEAVGIFPEGTRSADGKVAPFRNGVEFLVRRTGAAVVPIGLVGAHRAFGRGKAWPRPRQIVVRYGEVWPAERVLAPNGIEALRARVAELARASLRECSTGSPCSGPATAPGPTSSADSRA